MTDPGGGSESRPIYSIGAVATMLGLETATLRSWEDRYGVVVPARSDGAQRIYSRDDLERLRFVVDAVEDRHDAGRRSPAVGRALGRGDSLTRPDPLAATIVVLLAERDRYAAELLEYLLRTEGYDVCVAAAPALAEQMFGERRPELSIVELMMTGGGLELCARLARDGAAPVLAMSALDLADEAISMGASAFLRKPVVPLQFVSTVRDLLGSSALTRPSRAAIS